jgi:hypothetical protein
MRALVWTAVAATPVLVLLYRRKRVPPWAEFAAVAWMALAILVGTWER